MSDLPPFDPATGYLPPGWHPATTETLRHRCVDTLIFKGALPLDMTPNAPKHREKLFSGYQRLHDALQLLSIPTEQWIGGPFVTREPRPITITVVNFCDAQIYEALPAELRALVLNYLRGEESMPHCHCESYLVVKGPPSHPCNADYLKMFNYWHKILSSDQRGDPMGMVGITIEPAPDDDNEDAA